MYCKVCDDETEQIELQLALRGKYLPQEGSLILTFLCVRCGYLRIQGSYTDHMKLASRGYPTPTQEQLDSIDLDEALLNCSKPNEFYNKDIKWVNTEEFDDGGVYQEIFRNGFPKDNQKINRVVHFLSMKHMDFMAFGGFRCPIVYTMGGKFLFMDGFHRYCVLRYLGAKKIPVVVMEEY